MRQSNKLRISFSHLETPNQHDRWQNVSSFISKNDVKNKLIFDGIEGLAQNGTKRNSLGFWNSTVSNLNAKIWMDRDLIGLISPSKINNILSDPKTITNATWFWIIIWLIKGELCERVTLLSQTHPPWLSLHPTITDKCKLNDSLNTYEWILLIMPLKTNSKLEKY